MLDWGCGAGRRVVYIAEEGIEVTGMDRSRTAINITQDWLKDGGLEALLKNSEPDMIPPPPAKYDAVFSLFAIEHGTPQEIINNLSEIKRC